MFVLKFIGLTTDFTGTYTRLLSIHFQLSIMNLTNILELTRAFVNKATNFTNKELFFDYLILLREKWSSPSKSSQPFQRYGGGQFLTGTKFSLYYHMTDFTFFVSLKLHTRFTTLLTKNIGIFLKNYG